MEGARSARAEEGVEHPLQEHEGPERSLVQGHIRLHSLLDRREFIVRLPGGVVDSHLKQFGRLPPVALGHRPESALSG